MNQYNHVNPVYLGLYIVFLLMLLFLALKSAKRLFDKLKSPSRAATVCTLFLGIRGARKVSGAVSSLWNDAKAADKKVTDTEQSEP